MFLRPIGYTRPSWRLGRAPARLPGDFPCGIPICVLPPQAILDGWNRAHDGHGADALLAHVVRQIRTWRPSVILIPATGGSEGLSQIIQQSVTAAVGLAGDPAFLADQFAASGCEAVERAAGLPRFGFQGRRQNRRGWR